MEPLRSSRYSSGCVWETCASYVLAFEIQHLENCTTSKKKNQAVCAKRSAAPARVQQQKKTTVLRKDCRVRKKQPVLKAAGIIVKKMVPVLQ